MITLPRKQTEVKKTNTLHRSRGIKTGLNANQKIMELRGHRYVVGNSMNTISGKGGENGDPFRSLKVGGGMTKTKWESYDQKK